MIGRLKNLQELNVSFNCLKSIPPELGDCENLEKLDCSGNLELTELPFEVRKQSFLHYDLLLLGLWHGMIYNVGKTFYEVKSIFIISYFLDISITLYHPTPNTLYQQLEGLLACSYTRPGAEFKFRKVIKKKQTKLGKTCFHTRYFHLTPIQYMMPIVYNADPDLFIHSGKANWKQLEIKGVKLKEKSLYIHRNV